jgi:hypothetical protein
MMYITWAMAGACMLALVCRLDAMTWRTHQASVVAMHLGMALACIWAFIAPLNLGTIGAVLATSSWLWVSLPTWAGGPPEHTQTRGGDFHVIESLMDRSRT